MKKMGILGWIAFILVIIGALNWGLVGLLSFNLVTVIFGNGIISNIIFDLVGVAGLYLIVGAAMMKKE
jgi:uncharacterized protein